MPANTQGANVQSLYLVALPPQGAIDLDPSYAKAHLRKAQALQGLGRHADALASAQKAAHAAIAAAASAPSVSGAAAAGARAVEAQSRALQTELEGQLKGLSLSSGPCAKGKVANGSCELGQGSGSVGIAAGSSGTGNTTSSASGTISNTGNASSTGAAKGSTAKAVPLIQELPDSSTATGTAVQPPMKEQSEATGEEYDLESMD